MKPVDRYIQDVMACVFARPAERERFEADLRAHFADAEERGQTPARIIEDMGRPEDVAGAFNADRDFQYAGFWRRFVAFVGDLGVMGALCLIPLALVLPFCRAFAPEGEPSVLAILAMTLGALAFMGIVVFYFPLLEWRFGKTLGKHWLRIRVIRETGGPIGLGQAFVRRLAYYFEMIVIDALFIPFTEKKQRALDIIAKTIVAKEPGEEAPWWGWVICLALPLVCLLAIIAIAGLLSTVAWVEIDGPR
ncbi:MAG: RDD family protein [Thermoanaerobaculia bacterium]